MTLIDRLLRASSPQGGISGRLIALIFGSTFGAAGIAALWSTCISPISKSYQAQNWPEVPGTILESGLSPDKEDVIIKYEYTIEQQTYQGDTYSFTDTSRNFATTSFHQAVAKYQVNSTTPVLVNPANHQESVLDPSIKPIAWMGIFFSTPFITVGICGLTWALGAGWINKRSRFLREQAAEMADKRGAHHIANRLRRSSADADEAIIFLDGKDRLDGLGLLALCLFWNGIVSVFIFIMILMLMSGSNTAWFLGLFLIPFILIGSFIFREMIRSFTGPKAPNYIVIASPTEPVAEQMIITAHWCFLGDSRDSTQIKKFNFIISRGEGMKSLTKLKRKNRTGAQRFNQTDATFSADEKTCGHKTVELDPIPLKSYFRGSVKQTYQGSIDMIVAWDRRGEQVTQRDYVLGQTDND